MLGYIRRRTKIEVYKKFRAEVNRKELEDPPDYTWTLAKGQSPKSMPK